MLFEGINDPPCEANLPSLGLDTIPRNDRTDIDLYGYFQFAEAFQYYSLNTVRKWFTFKKEWRDKFTTHKDLVAHLRRGDYLTTYSSSFCVIAWEAYAKSMEALGYDPLKTDLVSDTSPTRFEHPGLEWLQDFFTLMNSKVLFRANSTFSWWAGTLGEAKVYSPVVDGQVGLREDIDFVEGNWPRCTTQPNTSDFILAGMKHHV